MGEKEADRPSHPGRDKKIIKTGLTILLLLTAGFGIGIWLAGLNNGDAKPPRHIIQDAGFPLYMPKKLPGNYQVDPQSFALTEGLLAFRATDGTGSTITFTEQRKPKDFDFDSFYKQQMRTSQTVNNTPYPSVAGEGLSGDTKIVSIVTDETWIIANTQSSLSLENMHVIAQNIRAHRD